ncbi:MAG: nucleotide exchange factor GrpE [Halothece sp.]
MNNEQNQQPQEEQSLETEAQANVAQEAEVVAEETPTAEGEAQSTSDHGENQAQPTSVASTEELEAEIQNLKQQLEQEAQQRETVSAQAKRLAADFENFRRRSETQKEEIKQNEKRETLTKILEIVDNFERARSQIKPETEGEKNIHKSYQGLYKQLVETLKSLGVSKMRPEGEPFDPYYHEAMLREPSNEHPEGTVIEELRAGYMLENTVLRHAMVKVAAAPEPSEEDNESSEENNNEQQPA